MHHETSCPRQNRIQCRRHWYWVMLLTLTLRITPVEAASAEVGLFGFYETSFQSSGHYENPYRAVEVQATIQKPDGSIRSLPLFWDGNNAWKLRISPDQLGAWNVTTSSNDPGLDNQKDSFQCIPSKHQGGIQPMPQAPHHFQRQDGTPFLFWGDTGWALYLDNKDEKLNRPSVLHYMDKRAEEGVNVIHSMLLSEAGWGNQGGDPFHDLSSEKINPAYWQEVDLRLNDLNGKGITGGLVVAWGDKQRKEPWAWRMFPNLEARKRYARYIAARYGAFNVYFILSGEWHAEARTRDNTTEKQIKQEFIEIGNLFSKAEPHGRMIAIHPMTSHGSVREFNDTEWMSFGDYQQNYVDLYERILESRSYNKPIVNSEYGYFLRDASGDGKVDKPNSATPDAMRFATWDILLAGGYPVTGYGTTYMGGHRDPGPFNPDDPRNDIWTRQYHHARRFLSGLRWWTLKPADNVLSCDQIREDDQTQRARPPQAKACRALVDPGRQYVLYARGITKAITFTPGDDATGRYNSALFNPRTGETKSGGKITLKTTFTWTPPDKEDWVFCLVNEKAQPSD